MINIVKNMIPNQTLNWRLAQGIQQKSATMNISKVTKFSGGAQEGIKGRSAKSLMIS